MSSNNRIDIVAGNILIKMEEVVENFMEKFKTELNTLVSEIKKELSMAPSSDLHHIGIKAEELAQKAISNLEDRLEDISEEICEVLSDELGVF